MFEYSRIVKPPSVLAAGNSCLAQEVRLVPVGVMVLIQV